MNRNEERETENYWSGRNHSIVLFSFLDVLSKMGIPTESTIFLKLFSNAHLSSRRVGYHSQMF